MKMISGRGLVLTHAHMSYWSAIYVLGGTCQLLGAGYHVYKDIWMAVEDEMLDCTREAATHFDQSKLRPQLHDQLLTTKRSEYFQFQLIDTLILIIK